VWPGDPGSGFRGSTGNRLECGWHSRSDPGSGDRHSGARGIPRRAGRGHDTRHRGRADARPHGAGGAETRPRGVYHCQECGRHDAQVSGDPGPPPAISRSCPAVAEALWKSSAQEAGELGVRILFATQHIHFPQGGGGAERNTHELSLALKEQGETPAVLCRLRPDGSWMSWSNRLRRMLPPRQEFPRDTMCGYPVFRGWNMERAGEVVRRFRPDVIVVQATEPDLLLRSFVPFGVPIVPYFHEVE